MSIKVLRPWALGSSLKIEVGRGGKFEELSYPSGPLSEFKLVQFQNRLQDGTECSGLGCARDLKTASLKAYFEFLERKAFFQHGISKGFRTTNGIAVHKFFSLAAKAATSELIERDAFLMHWYSKSPFKILPNKMFNFLAEPIAQVRSMGFQVLIAETELGVQPTFATFLVNLSTGGFSVGTSSGKTINQDVEKSFTEACTNLFLADGRADESAFERIRDQGFRTLGDHRAYWRVSASLPSWVVSSAKSGLGLRPEIDFKPQVQLLTDEIMPAVGVKAEGLLQLRVGLPNIQDYEIVRRRLLTVRREIPDFKEMFPHPIP